jgi:methylthioribulose-1-phosphate dehydratase
MSSHPAESVSTANFSDVAVALAKTAKQLHARGWLLGTSGNLSAVVQRQPLLIAMSVSGVDKGELTAENVVLVDDNANVIEGGSKASAETLLHLVIANQRAAGAVLHTHSIWTTILSDLFADEGGVAIEGYEMLKGLSGVQTHEHREWVPIIENSQDMRQLSATIRTVLEENRKAHGFILHKHGLYTWGKDLAEARRHVEILEFLIETAGRTLELRKKGF